MLVRLQPRPQFKGVIIKHLLNTKTHHIWLKSEGSDYRPWAAYVYLDKDYGSALNMTAHLTRQGYDVKLVTSTVTNIL